MGRLKFKEPSCLKVQVQDIKGTEGCLYIPACAPTYNYRNGLVQASVQVSGWDTSSRDDSSFFEIGVYCASGPCMTSLLRTVYLQVRF